MIGWISEREYPVLWWGEDTPPEYTGYMARLVVLEKEHDEIEREIMEIMEETGLSREEAKMYVGEYTHYITRTRRTRRWDEEPDVPGDYILIAGYVPMIFYLLGWDYGTLEHIEDIEERTNGYIECMRASGVKEESVFIYGIRHRLYTDRGKISSFIIPYPELEGVKESIFYDIMYPLDGEYMLYVPPTCIRVIAEDGKIKTFEIIKK